MILLKPITATPDTETVRRVAEGENFNEQSIVYIGPYIGYRDAPTLPENAAEQAASSITSRFADEFNVTAEVLAPDEQKAFLQGRWGEDFEEAPGWFDPPGHY